MDWRNYVDVSSCLLFEATGDSEADTDHFSHVDKMGALSEDTGLAEDDAFSCSYENECNDDFDHRTEDYVYVQDDENDDDDEEDEKLVYDIDEYHEDETEDEDAVDQIRNDQAGIKVLKRHIRPGPGGLEVEEQRKKSKVCGAQIITERDKDMHFWETCLAS